MKILILIKYIIEDFLTNRCNRKRIQKKLAKKHYYFHGNISLLTPENNNTLIGSTIITPKGIGKAYFLYPNEELGIEMQQPYGWTKFKFNQCYYYGVYNRLLDKFIPLSPKCYTYIIDNRQSLFYRITKHGFAMLHDKYIKEHEHIHMFNSKRGGRSLLLHLKKEGYEITKS